TLTRQMLPSERSTVARRSPMRLPVEMTRFCGILGAIFGVRTRDPLPSNVIPAPLVSEANKRDQAGIHAPLSLLRDRRKAQARWLFARRETGTSSTLKMCMGAGLFPLAPCGAHAAPG